jgi:superfamily II RNA helicase
LAKVEKAIADVASKSSAPRDRRAGTSSSSSVSEVVRDVERLSRRVASVERSLTDGIAEASAKMRKQFQRLSKDVRRHERLNAEFRQASRKARDETLPHLWYVVGDTQESLADLKENRVAALEARMAILERRLEGTGLDNVVNCS